MYSLWRGADYLGRINPELPSDDASVVFGMLEPSSAFMPGQALMQQTMLELPGAPVFHHVNASGDATVNTSGRQVSSARARSTAEFMRDSVPAHDQLILKDAANQVVSTRAISIMAMSSAGRSVRQYCVDAGVVFSGWCVVIAVP